jgi:hypothetical protein
MCSEILIHDLEFLQSVTSQASTIQGGSIFAPRLSVAVDVQLQTTVSLATDIRPRTAAYAYGVGAAGGTGAALSINGQAIVVINVGTGVS